MHGASICQPEEESEPGDWGRGTGELKFYLHLPSACDLRTKSPRTLSGVRFSVAICSSNACAASIVTAIRVPMWKLGKELGLTANEA